MTNKRRRSDSFDDDVHKHLAASHARIAELPRKLAIGVDEGKSDVVVKIKHKKYPDTDEEEPVPKVKFSTIKKQKKSAVNSTLLVDKTKKKATRLKAAKDFRMINDVKTKPKKKEKKSQWDRIKNEEKGDDDNGVGLFEQGLKSVKDKKKKEETKTTNSSHWQFTQHKEEGGDDDGADLLEQALDSLKHSKKMKMLKKSKKTREASNRQQNGEREDENEADLLERSHNKLKDKKKKKEEKANESKSLQWHSTQHKEDGEDDDVTDSVEQDQNSLEHLKKKKVKDEEKKRTSSKRHLMQQREEGEDNKEVNPLEQALNSGMDPKGKKTQEKVTKTKLLQGRSMPVAQEGENDNGEDLLMHYQKKQKKKKNEEKKTKASQLHTMQSKEKVRVDDDVDSLRLKDQKKQKQAKTKEVKKLQWDQTQHKETGKDDNVPDLLEQELDSSKHLEKKMMKLEKNKKKRKSSECHLMPRDRKEEDGNGYLSGEAHNGVKDKMKKKTEITKETKSSQWPSTQNMQKGEDDDVADPEEQKVKRDKKIKSSKKLLMQHNKEEEANDESDLSERVLTRMKGKKKKKEEKAKKTKSVEGHLMLPKEKEEDEYTRGLMEQEPGSYKHPKKQKKDQAKKRTSSDRHLTQQKEKRENGNGLDLSEQALNRRKPIILDQEAMPPYKKHKLSAVAMANVELHKSGKCAQKEKKMLKAAGNRKNGGSIRKRESNRQKKKLRKQRNLAAVNSNSASETLQSQGKEAEGDMCAATNEANEAAPMVKEIADASAPLAATTQSLKRPASQKTPKSIVKVKPVTLQTPTRLRQDKPLTVTDMARHKPSSIINAAKALNTTESETSTTTRAEKDPAVTKVVAPNTKAVARKNEKMAASAKVLMPNAASLIKTATEKHEELCPAHEALHQSAGTLKRAKKSPFHQVAPFSDTSSSSESENDDVELDLNRKDENSSLFSRLIDAAAREQWELLEVGRLIRLFAAEWDFEETQTAQFLHETCPELVSVDLLEGLNVNLSAEQLVQAFEAGSGSVNVLMNKMASAVENGYLSVRDPSFVSTLEHRVALMESNAEVLELLHPLLESLSTVRDVGALLKQLCQHWHLERTIALVQQILLSSVFDDLDGNQDDICLDLPDLAGRLDYPSRLDQEDVDENGNLKGLVVNEDSESSKDEGSEPEEDDEESEDDVEPYEGETDSDEEVEIAGPSKGRLRFIEDEADVGEEEEEDPEEENEGEPDSDGSFVSSNSY